MLLKTNFNVISVVSENFLEKISYGMGVSFKIDILMSLGIGNILVKNNFKQTFDIRQFNSKYVPYYSEKKSKKRKIW